MGSTKKYRRKNFKREVYQATRKKCNDQSNLFDVSESITDNSKSMNRILQNEPEPLYFSQFGAQTFDCESDPSASNDTYATSDKSKLAELERNLSFNGGWSQYNQSGPMSYGVVKDSELVHNNMMPYFSTRHGYGTNDLQNEGVMNYKNELFTGNISTWTHRRESKPLFSPAVSKTNIYGTPVRSEDELERYIPGRFHQNETPFDQIQVTPGLGLDADAVGTHGFHPTYRALDKTIDELRINPKETYEGRVIEGMRGQKRAVQAPVISYRPDSFKESTKADLLPKGSDVAGPNARKNYVMKETTRPDTHIEYTGGAFNSQDTVGRNVPEHLRELHKESTRQTFTLPKPLQKFSRVETIHNPNLKSYDLPFTSRDQTIHNNYIGATMNAANPTGCYANRTDIAKHTMKEITSAIPQSNTTITPNTMRGTVQPMDIANTTIKEMQVENKLNPHAASLNSAHRTYNQDMAKATMKESTIDSVQPLNPYESTNMYTNYTDNAKSTMKEITSQIPRNSMATPINRVQGATHYQDIAKSTMKEITSGIPVNTNLLPVNQQQRAPDLQDTARTTLRETTNCIPINTNFIPINQQQRAPDLQDTMRTTLKETTNSIYRPTSMDNTSRQIRANLQDSQRTTMRETTVQTPWNNFVIPVNQQVRAPDLQDTMRHTMKETTVGIHRQTATTPINQHVRAPNPQDKPRHTMKETTVEIPYSTSVIPINQHQRVANPTDKPRTTTRETTIEIPYNTLVTPINQHVRAPNPQDRLRNTMKETTVGIPYNTLVTPVNQAVRAPNPQDQLRTTIKETTNYIPRNTTISAVDQMQGKLNLQDIAKTTLKETTSSIPLNTFATGVNQTRPTPNLQDTAKTTTKETTVTIPFNTNTTAVNSRLGAATTFNRTPLRTTLKEQTSAIATNTNLTGVNQLKPTANPQDQARTTIKEQTVQIPYNTVLSAATEFKPKANLQDTAKTTTKEQTIQIPWNTNTTAIAQSKGAASTFDKTPLKATTKETTINNKYIGMANSDISGKGYGYIAQKMQAPDTNKQYTCQKTYIKPLVGDIRSRLYNDAYNAQIDDRKEQLHWYRKPTASNVNLAPDPANINVALKDDTKIAREPGVGYTVNNKLDRFEGQTTCKNIPNVSSDRFINPVLLEQLRTNPYV